MASTGGFELQGSDGDETRLLVHPTLGYSIAVPGRPHLIRATGDGPAYDAVLKMSDAPIELGFRMDEVPTKITPEKLVPGLLMSYAQMRARDPLAVQTSQLWGKTLCRGIDTGMRANYDLVGDVEDAMEFLAINVKPEGDELVRALHLTARYRKSETTPFAWSNLRAALLYHQSWIPGRLAPTPVWPAASVFTKLSARFELTEGAMAEAVAKAEVLPDIELDRVNRLADVLLELSNQGVPPINPWEPGLTDDIAYKIESCVPPSVSTVLLRNSAQLESMHDVRGFLWQCYWAVGNRAELLRRN